MKHTQYQILFYGEEGGLILWNIQKWLLDSRFKTVGGEGGVFICMYFNLDFLLSLVLNLPYCNLEKWYFIQNSI